MNRPDFSEYLAHFTKDGDPCNTDTDNPALAYRTMSAKDKLISILNDRLIQPSVMPWTHANAICFTECPWSSLVSHTKNYSSYGIGFSKAFIYGHHGGPVFYIRPDQLKNKPKREVLTRMYGLS
jgi:hypothetical protein